MIVQAQPIDERRENARSELRPAPLVDVLRGSITESRHHGHVIVLDGDGQALASLGAPDHWTFLRSSAKPHQTIPLVATGAADHFGFTESEIAIACGSHNGEDEHTLAVASMLKKIGLDESALHCGAHEPYGKEAAQELRDSERQPTALHNNCSGKHAAMLALSIFLGAPVENYEEVGHPVQRMIAQALAQFSGVPKHELGVGIDGCSAPNFAVPLRAMALMYARLVQPPAWLKDETRAACERIVGAVRAHPEMIEGRGELDTELMRATAGRVISKVGAEGVYTAGVLPCERFPSGLGIALKIEDGDKGERARSPIAIEIFRQLGLLADTDTQILNGLASPIIRNHRGDEVGRVVTTFKL